MLSGSKIPQCHRDGQPCGVLRSCLGLMGRHRAQGTCHQRQTWSFKVLIACLFFIFCHISPFSPSALYICQQKPCLFLPNHDAPGAPVVVWNTLGSNTLVFFWKVVLNPHLICSLSLLISAWASFPVLHNMAVITSCVPGAAVHHFPCSNPLHYDMARGSVYLASEYLVLNKICYLNKYI